MHQKKNIKIIDPSNLVIQIRIIQGLPLPLRALWAKEVWKTLENANGSRTTENGWLRTVGKPSDG